MNTYIGSTQDYILNNSYRHTFSHSSICMLRDKHEQTEEMCLEAVAISGENLRYVKNQTDEIIKTALKINPSAIKYVRNQTEEYCLYAIECMRSDTLGNTIGSTSEDILPYIQNVTLKICEELVKKKPLMLGHVPYQTEEMCLEALDKNVSVFSLIRNRTEKINLLAVKKSPYLLGYVLEQTEEMCLEAIALEPHSIRYVKNQTDKMKLEAVKKDPSVYKFIHNPSEEISLIAVKNKPSNLEFVLNKTYKICNAAVKNGVDFNLVPPSVPGYEKLKKKHLLLSTMKDDYSSYTINMQNIANKINCNTISPASAITHRINTSNLTEIEFDFGTVPIQSLKEFLKTRNNE